MICPKCGAVLHDDVKYCSSCGKCLTGGGFNASKIVDELDKLTAKIESVAKQGCDMLFRDNLNAPDRLVWNILATIFMFLPTGLVGCYYSYRVTRAKKDNNFSDAVAYSQNAKIWLALTIAIGLIFAPAIWRSLGNRDSRLSHDERARIEHVNQIAPGVWTNQAFEKF